MLSSAGGRKVESVFVIFKILTSVFPAATLLIVESGGMEQYGDQEGGGAGAGGNETDLQ